jgi:hypothetical protein
MIFVACALHSGAQQEDCKLKPPVITVHFGAGNASANTTVVPARYARVAHSCPGDGHYTITSGTKNCFRGDWFDVEEDHTPGDVNGNMLLVNSSYRNGMFLHTVLNGLKPGTLYEFSVWMMNVCRITEKCPFPLLPDILINLRTPEGKNVAQLSTGEVLRYKKPQWTQYRFTFTMPNTTSSLLLTMLNDAPGGCGNDFVLDDITVRECVKVPPPIVKSAIKKTTAAKKQVAAVKKPTTSTVRQQQPVASGPSAKSTLKVAPKKPVVKPNTKAVTKTAPKPVSKAAAPSVLKKSTVDSVKTVVVKPKPLAFPPPPAVLRARTNSLVREIQMDAGEIKIDLYDNGEIDGDTVSIYHNNRLLAAKSRLSQKAITFRIAVDAGRPYHELIMVAENLGSIPPNTSLMIVSAGDQRHEVFISSTKQKNAKVVLKLKE